MIIKKQEPYLYINLVTAQHDRDVLANALKITMPVGHVLVGDARGHVKHDDTALALDVITVAKTTELLLSSCIPDIEHDGAIVGREIERVNLDTKGGCVVEQRRSTYAPPTRTKRI